MPPRPFTTLLSTAVIAAAATLLPSPARAQPATPAPDYTKLIADKSPALVTIKFVLKSEGGEGMGDQEQEVTGTMMQTDGLVLCSSTHLGGGMMARMGGGGRGGAPTPTDIKVLIGDDTKGVEAKIIARDSELDLAWVKIKEPKGPYAAIDFSKSATATLGQTIYTIIRTSKFFDRVPVVREGPIGGIAHKPRQLYIPSTPLVQEFGVPAFNAAGQVIGVSALILPDSEDEDEAGGAMRGMISGLILPASEVLAATERAKQTAESAPDEAPAAPDTHAAPKDKPTAPAPK